MNEPNISEAIEVTVEAEIGDTVYNASIQGGNWSDSDEFLRHMEGMARAKLGDIIVENLETTTHRYTVRYIITDEVDEDGIPVIIDVGRWPYGEAPPLEAST